MKSTIGLSKVDLMSDRLLDINPELILLAIKEFIQPERADEIVDVKYNYVIEAIDSFTPKLRVINACLLYTSPSPRDRTRSRMPSSAWKKKKKK